MMGDTKNDSNTTLFFVKNSNHQFDPVEKFLKKRGYDVITETDVKTALDLIIETNPEYIFLAWDHRNENIRLVPKMVYKSCTGQVVPFIMSTQRDQIIQLESSGFENKLYPPLSGPAIIRVISKYVKKNQISDQMNAKKNQNAKKESSMIQVKSFFHDGKTDPEINLRRSSSLDENDRKMVASRNREQAKMFAQSNKNREKYLSSIIQDGVKAKLMQAIEEEILTNNLITADRKATLKENLLAAIDREFTNKGTRNSLGHAVEQEIDKLDNLTDSEQKQIKEKFLALLNAELPDDIFPGVAEENDEQTLSDLLPKETKNLSKGQLVFLDQSYTETIKPEMIDLIETYADLNDGKSVLKETTQVYVLALQDLEWTGYLTVASENYLDVASAQVILNNWIKQMIRVERIDQNSDNQTELPDSVLFEIRVPKIDFADFCSYKANFFKDVDYEGRKTMLAFFSFSPYQVVNSVHETHDMLELSTEFLQPNENLPFDINLYLKENKKFLLYLKPGSVLDKPQISRLLTHKVKSIYSNMDYELPLLRYKAEFNLHALIASYNHIKDSKT